MPAHDDLEQRLITMESLLSHQEETIRDLSDMVARQWEVIDKVTRDLKRLDGRVSEEMEALHAGGPEKPPPHW